METTYGIHVSMESASVGISILGLSGNVFGSVILHKMELKNIGGVRLLRYLAYTDIAVLMAYLLSTTLLVSGCGMEYVGFILFILSRSLYTFETYLTVLISFQRCMAMAFPFKITTYMGKSRINKILIVLVLMSVLIPIPACTLHYWRNVLNPAFNGTELADHDIQPHSSQGEWIYNRFILQTFNMCLPLIVLIVCNLLLVILRCRVGSSVQNINNKGPGQLTAVVLLITIMSLTTHLANIMSDLCCPSDRAHVRDNNCLPKLVTNLLLVNNCSTNFLCYCAIGRSFRRFLRSTIFKKGLSNRNTSGTSVNSSNSHELSTTTVSCTEFTVDGK